MDRYFGARHLRSLALAILVGWVVIFGISRFAHAEEAYSFRADGSFAAVYWNNGMTRGHLSVYQGGDPNNPETYLFYVVSDCWTGCTVVERGYGTIPNDAFVETGGGGFRLNVDTSNLPGFILDIGLGGRLSIHWKKTSDFWQRTEGSSQVHFGDVVQASSGTSHSTSAWAEGTLASYSIEGPLLSASMGRNQEVTVSIKKAQ